MYLRVYALRILAQEYLYILSCLMSMMIFRFGRPNAAGMKTSVPSYRLKSHKEALLRSLAIVKKLFKGTASRGGGMCYGEARTYRRSARVFFHVSWPMCEPIQERGGAQPAWPRQVGEETTAAIQV